MKEKEENSNNTNNAPNASYFFRFIAGSRLAFGNWEVHQEREQRGILNMYPADKANMMISDRRIKKYDFYHHYGLSLDVIIEAKTKEEGLEKAETLVLNAIGTICFLETCYTEPPQCILSYRYPADKDMWLKEYQATLIDDEFFQPSEFSLRIVNHKRLGIFLEKIIAADVDLRNAIYFALHWFWKAVGTRDKRDMFINLWISLEILENPLKKFYGLQPTKSSYPACRNCKSEASLCPNCHKDFSYKANSGFTGYKKLEEKVSDKKMLKFNKLHSNRSALVHSGGNLSVKDVDDSIFSTRVLINCAILRLLNLSDNMSDGVVMAKSEFRGANLPLVMEFKGSIKAKEIASIKDTDKQPSVDAKYSYSYKIDDGEIISNCDVQHTFNDVFEEGKVEKVVKSGPGRLIKDLWERKN